MTGSAAATTAPSTWGAQLREGRLALGLTVDDVAAELRLAPGQVLALERGIPEGLPNGPYLRGYVRSYGRLVGVSLASAMTEAPHSAGARRSPAARRARRERALRRLARGLGYAALGVAAAVFLSWWYGWSPSMDHRIDLATGRSVMQGVTQRAADGHAQRALPPERGPWRLPVSGAQPGDTALAATAGEQPGLPEHDRAPWLEHGEPRERVPASAATATAVPGTQQR